MRGQNIGHGEKPNQTEDLGGQGSLAPPAAVSPETRLLSAFKKDTEDRKVDLARTGGSITYLLCYI